ncbi:zinc-binding dehydrogenase [Streptomyces sp. NPDC054784]
MPPGRSQPLFGAASSTRPRRGRGVLRSGAQRGGGADSAGGPGDGVREQSSAGELACRRTRTVRGGVDKAVDTVGTARLNQSVASLPWSGEVVFVGLFTQRPEPLDTMALIAAGASVRYRRGQRDLIAAVGRHAIRPVIDSRFPFHEAPAALARHRGVG